MKYTEDNSVSVEEKCIICGNLIENDLRNHHPLLKKLIEKNPNKCYFCLEKIYTLKAYTDIKKHIPVKAGEYRKIYQEFDKETLDYYFSILKKYDLVESFNQDVFFLKEEDDFYETEDYRIYSKFLEDTFKKETSNDADFDRLDLIIQEELESENLKQNSIENQIVDTNDTNLTTEEEIEETHESEDMRVFETKEEIITPPTVKRINISNLLGKKEPKTLDKQNEDVVENKIKIEKTENTNDKLIVGEEKIQKDSVEEKQDEEPIIKKDSSNNNPLPQIKHINISNLLGKKEPKEKTQKDVSERFIKNSEPKPKEKLPKKETIVEEVPKLESSDVIEEKLETKYIDEVPEDESESEKLKKLEFRDDTNSEVVSETTDVEEINNLYEKVEDTKENHNLKDTTKESNTKSSEMKPKIPPKKSNGQYSLHKGISYKIGVFKWTADIREKGKLKSLGLFDTEEEAYQARQEYINKKNLNNDESSIPPKKSNNRFSLHDRVDYDLNKGKWFAYVNEYGEDKFLGYFDTEKEAYSRQCKYLNIYVPTKQKNGQYSLHNGVSFNKRYCKWTSTIRGRKRNRFLGYFCSELDALKAIELYEESNGKILNIWNPPAELSSEADFDSDVDKFVKTFSYEPVSDDCIQISLNAKLQDDTELFNVLYKLNSFYIKILSLDVKDMVDFISLRANFKIKSNTLNKFIMTLKDDGWIK